MIPYKKHPFIKGEFQISRGIMPREIIGPRLIVRKGPVKEGGISPFHFFSIWPKTERKTILSFRSLPKTISLTNPFAKERFAFPVRTATISTQKIPYHKSPSKTVISTNIPSDSGLIGAGMGAILSILLYLM